MLKPLQNLIEVEIKYAGLNFADNYMREGLNSSIFPHVLGIEASGIITDIGIEVETHLKVRSIPLFIIFYSIVI